MGLPSASDLGALHPHQAPMPAPSPAPGGGKKMRAPKPSQASSSGVGLLARMGIIFAVFALVCGVGVGVVWALKKPATTAAPAPAASAPAASSEAPVPAPSFGVVRGLGYGVSCTASASGVRCVGRGEDGADMDATASGFEGARIVSVGVGSGFYTAIDSAGGVWVWGKNAHGELAGLEGVSLERAVKAGTVDNFMPSQSHDGMMARHYDVMVGREHACALDAAGGVWCWGGDRFGQVDGVAQGSFQKPRKIEAAPASHSLASSGYDTCASSDEATWCWGFNGWKTLSTDSARVLAPTKVEE